MPIKHSLQGSHKKMHFIVHQTIYFWKVKSHVKNAGEKLYHNPHAYLHLVDVFLQHLVYDNVDFVIAKEVNWRGNFTLYEENIKVLVQFLPPNLTLHNLCPSI